MEGCRWSCSGTSCEGGQGAWSLRGTSKTFRTGLSRSSPGEIKIKSGNYLSAPSGDPFSRAWINTKWILFRLRKNLGILRSFTDALGVLPRFGVDADYVAGFDKKGNVNLKSVLERHAFIAAGRGISLESRRSVFDEILHFYGQFDVDDSSVSAGGGSALGGEFI